MIHPLQKRTSHIPKCIFSNFTLYFSKMNTLSGSDSENSRIAYNSVLKRTPPLRIIRRFSMLDCVFARLRINQFGRELFLSGLYATLRGWIAAFTRQRTIQFWKELFPPTLYATLRGWDAPFVSLRTKRTSPANFVRCPARLGRALRESAYKENFAIMNYTPLDDAELRFLRGCV